MRLLKFSYTRCLNAGDRKHLLHKNYYNILYLKNKYVHLVKKKKKKVILRTYDKPDTGNKGMNTTDMVPATEEPCHKRVH